LTHTLGIVSLLFCGICLKHYAYHNMSRRTQLTTKFIFQVLAQLSENFIFIYLGLSLFTGTGLEYKPLFILVSVLGICLARWMAVFPLSALINWFLRLRARRRGRESAEEIPWAHQAMLFWAGLRGAVGVALAQGLTGTNSFVLRATVLVVVVLTVIIFGGTTARMLEILGIKTGVADEVDSDDEFDIEVVSNGTYIKKGGLGIGNAPKLGTNGIPLSSAPSRDEGRIYGSYSSGSAHGSPPGGQDLPMAPRKSSSRNLRHEADVAAQALLSPADSIDDEVTDLDLPPLARRPPQLRPATRTVSAPAIPALTQSADQASAATSGGSIRQFLQGSTEDPSAWFRQIDEGFIKPKLLLDPGDGSGHHGPGAV